MDASISAAFTSACINGAAFFIHSDGGAAFRREERGEVGILKGKTGGVKKTILLTGGTGFLGSNLLRGLLGTHSVILLKRSFSDVRRIRDLMPQVRAYDADRDAFPRVFAENRVDLVIHCATNYGRRSVSVTEMTEANLILPLRLIQEAKAHGVSAFINTDTILDKRVNAYSLSKSQFVDWMRQFSESMVCVNIALEHFYGPFDDRSKFVTKVVSDLIEGVGHIDLTPGKQRRDFIFIDDVVTAFHKVIDFSFSAAKSFYHFEVGTGRSIAIGDFVRMAKELTGNSSTELRFGAIPYRRNEIMESRVDVAELVRLGWRPRTSIREGLRKLIESERGESDEISYNRGVRFPGSQSRARDAARGPRAGHPRQPQPSRKRSKPSLAER